MEYETRTYFTEHEYDDVKGFSVLAAEDGEYHIAEKWLASSASEADSEASSTPENDVWLDYWVPESDLQDRVADDLCEPKAKLTEEQFEQVCKKVGRYTEQFDGADPITA